MSVKYEDDEVPCRPLLDSLLSFSCELVYCTKQNKKDIQTHPSKKVLCLASVWPDFASTANPKVKSGK